jgi:probable phosphoglycerate mutase
VSPPPRTQASAPTRARGVAKAARARARAKATPKPTVVFLVRHGLTPTTGKVMPGRAPGLHLAETGRAQAERVAERIGALSPAPSAIYASPLERTQETAAPIAKALGLRVRANKGLLDCAVGSWEGKSLKTLAKVPEWRTVVNWPTGFRFPGGESLAEMSLRAMNTMHSLVAEHRGERIVCVSHADPIKMIVGAAAGVPLDMFQRIVISPCSVSAVMFGLGGPIVLCVNSTGSLSDLVPS